MRIRKRQDVTLLGHDEVEAILYLLEASSEETALREQLKGLWAFKRVGGAWAVIELDVDPTVPWARDLPGHYGLEALGQRRGDGRHDPDLTLQVEEGVLTSLRIRSYDPRLMPACPSVHARTRGMRPVDLA